MTGDKASHAKVLFPLKVNGVLAFLTSVSLLAIQTVDIQKLLDLSVLAFHSGAEVTQLLEDVFLLEEDAAGLTSAPDKVSGHPGHCDSGGSLCCAFLSV